MVRPVLVPSQRRWFCQISPKAVYAAGMEPIALRPATAADRDRVLAWANEPTTRAMSFAGEPIRPAAHGAWFAARLRDPDSRLYVVEDAAGVPLGLVRFVRRGQRWELGISLAAAARGRGLGAAAIAAGLERLRAECGPVAVVARTRPENVAFRRAAARAGFGERGPGLVRGQAAVVLVWP